MLGKRLKAATSDRNLKSYFAAFLILIGVLLIVEGLEQHVNRGYVYFAMAFALVVELLNMRMRKAQQAPVELRQSYVDEDGGMVAGE